MINSPTSKDWDLIKLSVLQAMLGEISSNFRMICLSRKDDEWILSVVLETHNSDDLTSVDNILNNFSTTIEDVREELSVFAYSKISKEVLISTSTDIFPIGDARSVCFLRRE